MHPVPTYFSIHVPEAVYQGGFILYKCITFFFGITINLPCMQMSAKVVAGLWLTFRIHLRRIRDNKQTCTHTGCTPNGLSRPSFLSVYGVTWVVHLHSRTYVYYVYTPYYIIPFMWGSFLCSSNNMYLHMFSN